MASLRDVPLGQPRIRWSELTDDSPEYFKFTAAPDKDTLVFMWSFLGLFNLLVSFTIAVVFISVAMNAKARRKPFNVFLMFLMVPDFLESFSCFMTCWLSAWKGEYYSPAMCRYQAMYIIFGAASKAWLSFLATYQVHRLLVSSKKGTHYVAPGPRGVAVQSIMTYVYCFGLSLIIWIPGNWPPHEVEIQGGLVCIPAQDDGKGGYFFFLVFFPIMIGVPIAYMLYSFFDIWYRDLLPPMGSKSRKLTFYFLTIDVIYLMCWVPALFVSYVLQGINPWGLYAMALLAHGHGAVSAIASTRKPDIQKSVNIFLWGADFESTTTTSKPKLRSTSTTPSYSHDATGNSAGAKTLKSTTFITNTREVLKKASSNAGASRSSIPLGNQTGASLLVSSSVVRNQLQAFVGGGDEDDDSSEEQSDDKSSLETAPLSVIPSLRDRDVDEERASS